MYRVSTVVCKGELFSFFPQSVAQVVACFQWVVLLLRGALLNKSVRLYVIATYIEIFAQQLMWANLDYLAVGRSENSGVQVLFGRHNLPSPVRIGLTDLPNIEAPSPPIPVSLHLFIMFSPKNIWRHIWMLPYTKLVSYEEQKKILLVS